MYTAYWNLRESPFLNVVSDKLIYMTEQHREGIARLYYLIDQERVAGMLTGTYGVGKTMTLTFLQHRAIEAKLPVIKIDAIPNGALPMARHILRSLNLPDPAQTLPEALMLLQAYCEKSSTKLVRHLLLIDEAHHLVKDDGLYLAHYLCNLRIAGSSTQNEMQLFTTILAGTEELRTGLEKVESLRRRIQLDWQFLPLTATQTTEYVQHHMRVVGGDIWCFTHEALDAIYSFSQGIPRSINNLCDTALMLGFAAQLPHISKDLITQAAKDTGLDQYVN